MAFELAFLLTGIILLIGFLGDFLFRKTTIPDVLILMFFGFLLGPVLSIINVADLSSITPLFASLALLVILFDGGLNLDLFKVINEAPRAIVLACIGVVVSMVLTAALTTLFLKWNLLGGLLLGAIVGGTSSSIVVPMISRSKTSEKAVTLLSLESTFTDALVVVLGITLLQILQSTTLSEASPAPSIAGQILAQFSIGIVMGAVVGIVWLRVLKRIQGQTYDDILTLAIVLLFFSLVEAVGGNGAIFALSFGLILGNGKEISRMLKEKGEPMEASKVMRKFQSQISFLIRTFFFVYLGLIFSISNSVAVVYGILITLLVLGGRYLSVIISSIRSEELRSSIRVITVMFPRGLAAAIMAQIVLVSGIPNSAVYSDIVITVVIASVILSSVGFSIVSRREKHAILSPSSYHA